MEFAIVGPIFLMLLYAGFEIGLLFTRQVIFENQIDKISKYIYVGMANKQNITQADVQDQICNNIGFIFNNCRSNVAIELKEINNYQSLPSNKVTCIEKSSDKLPVYSTGSSSSVMYMRACMTIDLLLPFYGFASSLYKTQSGRYQLVFSTAFMNEPF